MGSTPGFTGNSNLNTHLSIYYNKLVMSRQTTDPPNPADGKIVRFRSSSQFKVSGYQIQSIKRPLENRVWFEHEGETIQNGVGPTGRASKRGRVLDDGTSQIYRYEQNAVGKRVRHIDPLGKESVFVYGTGTTPDSDATNGTGIDLLEARRRNGAVFETLGTFTYNTKHRLLTATDALGNTYSYTYNSQGQLLTATTPATTSAPAGAKTTLVYDSNGYLLTATGPVPGSTTTYTYDSFGRVRTITPPLQGAVTLDYDNLDRLTRVTYPDSTYEEILYNRLDGERFRDRLGRWSHLRFDAVRRLTASMDTEGRTLTLDWCGCGVLEALIDANGNRTSWEYDLQRRVTKEIRANGAQYLYAYENVMSRLKTVTDPRNIVTTFEYFGDNRLKKKSFSDTTPQITFTYDYLGRLSTAANGTDTLSWTYDRNSQVLSEASTKNSSTVSYSYDPVGNRRTTSLNGTPFNAYDYDSALRLEAITRGANVFSFDYDAASRRTSLIYPNGITTTYAYDTESRLQRLTAKLGASTVTDFQYTYNAVGNRTQKVTPDLTETYEYDRADQLVEVLRTGTGANRWAYTYDPAGNRTTEQIGNAPVQASFNNMNRLNSTSAGGALVFKGTLNEPAAVTIQGKVTAVDSANKFEGAVNSTSGTNTVAVVATDPMGNTRTNTYEVNVSGSGKTYSYDTAGNLTQKVDGAETWTYEWNAENQLKKVLKNAATIATFAYDPLGRRVEKIVGATTTSFTYDGEDILRQTAGGTTAYYVHGAFTDEPLAKETTGSTSFFHAEALGSIVKLSNSSGGIIHEYRFGVFGGIELGGSQGGYSFTGREYDDETNLFYYRSRYYDAQTARFLSEDPIDSVIEGNEYRYVRNNPVNLVDPTGESWAYWRAKLLDFALKLGQISDETGQLEKAAEAISESIEAQPTSEPGAGTGGGQGGNPKPPKTPPVQNWKKPPWWRGGPHSPPIFTVVPFCAWDNTCHLPPDCST